MIFSMKRVLMVHFDSFAFAPCLQAPFSQYTNDPLGDFPVVECEETRVESVGLYKKATRERLEKG
jgi:hypothetical protein